MIKRLYDLLIKVLSVKGLFVIIATTFYFLNPGVETAFWGFIASWFLLVLGREAIKWIEILKK